ncbi:MAG TPA: hypothetical protein VFX30_13130 [bacterium]|nr:hypothetical protein [bacterium]
MRKPTLRFASALLLSAYFGAISGCGTEADAPTNASQSADSSDDPTTLALDPWEAATGLEGGNLKTLSRSDDNLVVMGDAGVFQWTDADGFSELPDAGTLSDFGLEASPSPADAPEFGFLYRTDATHQLFAVVGGELFRRDGDRWIDTGEHAHSLGEMGGILYLRRPGEILKSEDGEEWTSLTPIPSESGDAACCFSRLAADPARNRLYVFNNNGVFAYDLASGTWTALDPGDDLFHGPQTDLRVLFVDPSDGDVYVGTVFDLYVSEDGQSWSPPIFKTQTGIWGTMITALARDSSTGALYAATSRGVFERTGSPNWTALPSLKTTVNDLSAKDGTLWAATSSGLWSEAGSGWVSHAPKGLSGKNIQAMESAGGFLYAQSDEIVYAPLPGSDDVLAAFHVVYKQVGPGAWVTEQHQAAIDAPTPAFDPELDTTVFARFTITPKNLRVAATPKGLFFSLEETGPWTAGGTGLPTLRVTSFAYDAFNQVLYAGTIGHGVYQLSLADLH